QKERETDEKDDKKPEAVRENSLTPRRKLSYKEQREFDMLEKELVVLEKEKKELSEKLSTSNLSFEELQKFSERIAEISNLIDEKELRWLELSET
ncbi:MAG TPA: ABC transporter C-terminal domain-containing protein, partial [Flavisolibacter sp.]|nr:ABC transporter C-terminal domain-containing protein [Flavisolibacter sp.]